MKIEVDTISRIRLSNTGFSTGPIDIIIDDFAIGKGKLVISYGDQHIVKTLTHLGFLSTAEYLAKTDKDTLISELINLDSTVQDFKQVGSVLTAIISHDLGCVASGPNNAERKSELLKLSRTIPVITCEEDLNNNIAFLQKALGAGWRNLLPVTYNPQWHKAVSVIGVVKEGMNRHVASLNSKNAKTG